MKPLMQLLTGFLFSPPTRNDNPIKAKYLLQYENCSQWGKCNSLFLWAKIIKIGINLILIESKDDLMSTVDDIFAQ